MKHREEITPELVEACLQALAQGQPIEAILSRYPEAAADLAPLLQVAQHSRDTASTLRVPLAARARSRARFLERARHLRTTAVSPLARLPRPGWAWGSLVIILVLLMSLVVTTWASAQALPGQPLYPLKRAVEAVQYSLTTDPSARLTLAETLDQKRAAEVQALIQQGQQQKITLAGFLTRGATALWEVNQIPLLLSPDQEALARSLEGAYVSVRGETVPSLGVKAQRIELQLLTVRGVLREMTSEYLRLDGLPLWLSPATQRRGGLRVGQSVSATVVRLAPDQYLALVVQGQGGDGTLVPPNVLATPWLELRRDVPRVLPSPSHREDAPESRPIEPPGLSKQTERPRPTARFEATAEREDEDRDKTPEPTRTLRPSKTPKPTEFEAKRSEPTEQKTEAEHDDEDKD